MLCKGWTWQQVQKLVWKNCGCHLPCARMKRALCLLILVSMTLHCASRLGLLSYLYQNRHTVAFTLGLISEIPIAVCSSDYEGGKTLVITAPDETDKSLPATISHAGEINLYFERITFNHTPHFYWLATHRIPALQEIPYTPPLQDIFHPPTAA